MAYKILSPQTEGWDDLVGLGTYKLTLARQLVLQQNELQIEC